MTTKKPATKVDQSLSGAGAFNPAAAMVDAANRPVGLTAANPGGIVLLRKQQMLDYFFGTTAMPAADVTLYVGLLTGTYTGGTSDIAILQGTFTANPEVVVGTAAGQWNNYAVYVMTNGISDSAHIRVVSSDAGHTQVTSGDSAHVLVALRDSE